MIPGDVVRPLGFNIRLQSGVLFSLALNVAIVVATSIEADGQWQSSEASQLSATGIFNHLPDDDVQAGKALR